VMNEGSWRLIFSATGDLIICAEPSAISELAVVSGDTVWLCLRLHVSSLVF
jgi:hypothetical protein